MLFMGGWQASYKLLGLPVAAKALEICYLMSYRSILVWKLQTSLLQQPGPKKFKLSKIEQIYKAKKFKVPPFTIQEKRRASG